MIELAKEEAIGAMPIELLHEMDEWRSTDETRVHHPKVWVRIASGRAGWLATDGHRMLRADFPSSLPEGDYLVDFEAGALLTSVSGFPNHFYSAELWAQKAPKGPWSFEAAYVARIGAVEKALTKARLREFPPKGSAKEKQRQRQAAGRMFLASFELGGLMDPARYHFGSTAVRALIMPRRS